MQKEVHGVGEQSVNDVMYIRVKYNSILCTQCKLQCWNCIAMSYAASKK